MIFVDTKTKKNTKIKIKKTLGKNYKFDPLFVLKLDFDPPII